MLQSEGALKDAYEIASLSISFPPQASFSGA